MATAQAVLRELLREHVGPALRARGFAGSGQDFHRRIDGNWAAVNIQRDRYSTAEEVRFTVNLGTASTEVRLEDGFSPDAPAREVDCHWRTRIGSLLPGHRDTWWSVRATSSAADIERLGATLAGHLSTVAVPRLEMMAPDEAILTTVLDGKPQAGMSPADMDVVGPILRRLGPPDRLARWLAILDEPGEGEAAIKLYTLYDDYPPARLSAKRIEQRLDKLTAAGFEPRQQALLDLGFAPADEGILRAIRPFLNDNDWRVRFAAAQSLGRLGDAAAAPSFAALVRMEPVRFAAVHAAFALVRLDRLLDSAGRAETRVAVADRRGRAVGHDRAALSHLLRSLDPPG